MGWLIFAAYEVVAVLASRAAYATIREVDGVPRNKVDAGLTGFMAMLIGHL